MTGRTLFFVVLLCCGGSLAIAGGDAARPVFRFGLTPVVLHENTNIYVQLERYLGKAMGLPVKAVQRGTYAQIMDALKSGEVEAAWVCGLPYTRNASWLHLVAVPLNGFDNNKPLYRSLIITSNENVHSLTDLRGRVYAFSDPDSNSGHLVPEYLLHRRGSRPDLFFRAFFFTNSHRKVVRAVSAGLADGGSVDSYVFHALQKDEPELTRHVRVIETSEEFAFPPVVAPKKADSGRIGAFQRALLGMRDSRQGRRLLHQLHLAGFTRGRPEMFASIQAMDREVFTLAVSR